jgi:hypothetical protein
MSIDDILTNWKMGCGIEKTSDGGSTYLVIPIADRRGHFLDLIQAMVSYGYSKDEIKSPIISTKVVKTCWSDLIKKMSDKGVRKARDISRNQWEDAQKEFFAIPLPKYVRHIKPEVPLSIYKAEEHKKEVGSKKILEIEPSDRIKMDTSDIPDAPLDLDFLKEIGVKDE